MMDEFLESQDPWYANDLAQDAGFKFHHNYNADLPTTTHEPSMAAVAQGLDFDQTISQNFDETFWNRDMPALSPTPLPPAETGPCISSRGIGK
jgi:hypothetical protein